MGWYPQHIFRVDGDPVPNNEDNNTVVNADYVNKRDGEITAIEQALGIGLVPSGTVSLSTYFKTDGTSVLMAFNDGGKVGVGTTSPSSQIHQRWVGGNVTYHELEVGGLASSSPTAYADLDFTADRVGSGYWRFARVRFQRANDGYHNNEASIQFWTGNNNEPPYPLTERMRIAANGYVGIGTTNPAARVHWRVQRQRRFSSLTRRTTQQRHSFERIVPMMVDSRSR